MRKKFAHLQKSVAAFALGITGILSSPGCNAQQTQTAANPAAVNPTVATPLTTAAKLPNGSRPNVLLILADDLGWSDIGCFGSEIKTPNIDSLAADGLSFTQFYNSARCCPSRASLMTGLAPHQAGFPDMSGVISDHAVTLPEVLKDAGYSTSMVGKWHLSNVSTPVKRGFDEFYGMLGGFNSYDQEHPYYTRAPADRTARTYQPGQFYSTNAFGDYSIDFIDQAQKTGKPWFQYLAFNAAHFPLMAPESVIQKYEPIYQQGWDKIREGRFERQKQLGLVPKDMQLTPRSVVPPNFINVQTGWADKQNPAWDSLPADRRADLARRMAVYAAIIDIMDQNVGRVIKHLKDTHQYDNTLIFFLSDNGACAEWDPFGFDKLDSTLNVIHKGDDLKKIGTADSYISYGSGWANACNTPWRLYKHYGQEGGIRTPLLVHWPKGLKVKPGSRTDQPGQIADIMPTLVQLCGATYPTERNGISILPTMGTSLAPMLSGEKIGPRTLCMEHEGNRMVRQGDWKLVALSNKPWELYDLSKDPAEMNDLSTQQPDRVKQLNGVWQQWAETHSVIRKPSPQLVDKEIDINCDVNSQATDGVILAQGGNQRGYAVYVKAGKPVFAIRQAGTLYTAASDTAASGKYSIEAHMLKSGEMTLAVNGTIVGHGKAPGVFTAQPADELSIGEDTLSAVGDYTSPNPLKGDVTNVNVVTK